MVSSYKREVSDPSTAAEEMLIVMNTWTHLELAFFKSLIKERILLYAKRANPMFRHSFASLQNIRFDYGF